MFVITVDIGQSLRPVRRRRRSSGLLGVSLPAKITVDEEGATECSDEDNGDCNSGYSSCTNTVGAIAGSLNDASTARGWLGC